MTWSFYKHLFVCAGSSTDLGAAEGVREPRRSDLALPASAGQSPQLLNPKWWFHPEAKHDGVVSSWVELTIRCRNAEIVGDDQGFTVVGEFDVANVARILASTAFLDAMLAALAESDIVTQQLALGVLVKLMEHMTQEELLAVFDRFLPPSLESERPGGLD